MDSWKIFRRFLFKIMLRQLTRKNRVNLWSQDSRNEYLDNEYLDTKKMDATPKTLCMNHRRIFWKYCSNFFQRLFLQNILWNYSLESLQKFNQKRRQRCLHWFLRIFFQIVLQDFLKISSRNFSKGLLHRFLEVFLQ